VHAKAWHSPAEHADDASNDCARYNTLCTMYTTAQCAAGFTGTAVSSRCGVNIVWGVLPTCTRIVTPPPTPQCPALNLGAQNAVPGACPSAQGTCTVQVCGGGLVLRSSICNAMMMRSFCQVFGSDHKQRPPVRQRFHRLAGCADVPERHLGGLPAHMHRYLTRNMRRELCPPMPKFLFRMAVRFAF
jgi:hypothetical protein